MILLVPALFLVFLRLSFAIPTEPWARDNGRKNSPPHAGLGHRNSNHTVQLSASDFWNDLLKLAAIIGTADLSTSLLDEFKGAQREKEEDWIKQTVGSLANQFPTDNVLIYHDTESTASDFTESVYSHYDVDQFPFWKKGYEIWVFKTGKFERANDGGVRNWYFTGCYQRTDDVYVDFAPRDSCPYY